MINTKKKLLNIPNILLSNSVRSYRFPVFEYRLTD